MIKKINEVLKSEDVALEVKSKTYCLDTVLNSSLADGFSVEFELWEATYTMELIEVVNDDEVVYEGVYITKDGKYIASYIA